ncbi:MAG: glycosyltransferase [Aquabacterium sp.]|nr:glycosyltransferase [Aquabacterium sp.]
MSALRILYLGTQSGTCLDRAHAYRRLGHHVEHVDPRRLLPESVWTDRVSWHLGGHLLAPWLKPRLVRVLAKLPHFDLCHVDCGEWVTPDVVALLRQKADAVINYCIDDPTGPRDGLRFKAYRQSASAYDLLVVMRQVNVQEAKALGARRVLRVFMSADEVSHAPRPIDARDLAIWASDVLFLGSWMPERGPFLKGLIERGVPLSIRGAHWHKAPEWPLLQPFWLGGAIGGDDYAKAIQCAKVNLGLLSKGNRDLHTTRSLEVPAVGGLLCAERTSEHEAMYAEGHEAVFWRSVDECASQCHALLAHDAHRRAMALAGQQRLQRNGNMNERVLQRVLDEVAS